MQYFLYYLTSTESDTQAATRQAIEYRLIEVS